MKNQYYEDERNNVVDFEEFIDKEFGNRGTKRREKFEEGYEAFKPGVMLQEMPKTKKYDSKATCRKLRHYKKLYFKN